MRLFLLAASWVHLASSILLTGAFFMLLLAGNPSERPTARRWERTIAVYSRRVLLVALGSGIACLLARTAVFEGRLEAALEPRAVWRALLDTRPGLIWLARHGLLVVLGAFLLLPADVRETRNWIASRVETLVLGTLALLLTAASREAGADSRLYAERAVRRFSGAALATMIVLIASGSMNAF